MFSQIVFNTPGELANSLPYSVPVAGRTVFPENALPISKRFNQHTLIYCLKGMGKVKVQGNQYLAQPGDLVWIDTSRNYSHAAENNTGEWHYLWMSIEGMELQYLFELLRANNQPVFQFHRLSDPSSNLSQIFTNVLKELDNPRPFSDVKLSTNVANIINILFSYNPSQKFHLGTQYAYGSLTDIINLMRSNLDHHWTVNELAKKLSISSSQLHRRFKQTLGTSPIDWLRCERINQAKLQLTEKSLKVIEVAKRCGYRDPYYFSRDFKNITGQTPSEFRQALRQQIR